LLADRRPIHLGGRAFDLLMALIEASGAVVSKNTLMERVWPNWTVGDNSIHVQISALRRAFAADRNLIRTVPGRGYQFTGEIRLPTGLPTGRELPDALTAVVAAQGPRTNLPKPASELVARDAELAAVTTLVAIRRLVTLTGAGGVGKTRLGLEAARYVLPEFRDGIWVADLAPVSDSALVAATVALALGLSLGSSAVSLEHVANAVASRQLMLVLDNCEHVVDAAARISETLLCANPLVRVIATSREPLRAEGEWIYQVPPLGVPVEGSLDGQDPQQYGAIRLFIERARAADPHFSPDKRVTAIAEICRRLDGIPLAIELAASLAAATGIEEVAARLDDQFDLLIGGRRTALPRHRSLRAMLDWSYGLLLETERVVLRRLAIFAGDFAVDAAIRVVESDDIVPSDVVRCLAKLVTKSLIVLDISGTAVHYRLLETTRAYALEKLNQSGEVESTSRRYSEILPRSV
jgi:predicted ATPase/DNA-binding winged helix-turn-helix (wHTH) protein